MTGDVGQITMCHTPPLQAIVLTFCAYGRRLAIDSEAPRQRKLNHERDHTSGDYMVALLRDGGWLGALCDALSNGKLSRIRSVRM